MKESCQFLAHGRSGDLRCVAGVNFGSVGSERAQCRVCALQDWGDAPLCPNAEIYTFLKRDETGRSIVRFEMDCALRANAPAQARCDTCAERENAVQLAAKVNA